MPDPVCEALSIERSGSHLENDALGIIDRAGKFVTVEKQECFHRGMPDALVAVAKGMILNEGEA